MDEELLQKKIHDNKKSYQLFKFTKEKCVLLSVVLFTTILTVTVLLLKLHDAKSVSCSTGNTNCELGIRSNKINESVWKKHQVINERVIIENTSAKPKGQRKSTQEIVSLCKKKTDKLFLIFTKNLIVNLKYDPLFDDMKALKCFFIYIHANISSTLYDEEKKCDTPINVNFNNFLKIRDLNIKDVEALSRYTKLFAEFIPSLENLKMFSKYIHRNLEKNLTRKLNIVTEGLKDFNNDMEKVIKRYKKCKLPFNYKTTVIPTGIIVPYNNSTLSKLNGVLPKEKIAASVFKQILYVKNHMLQDLDHRRKCLS